LVTTTGLVTVSPGTIPENVTAAEVGDTSRLRLAVVKVLAPTVSWSVKTARVAPVASAAKVPSVAIVARTRLFISPSLFRDVHRRCRRTTLL
jgi:hypothetical protein